MFSWIAQGFKDVISTITSVVGGLIPSEEEKHETTEDLEETINDSADTVISSFDFYKDVQNNVNDIVEVVTDTSSAPCFYVTVGENKWFSGEVKVLDLSWYEPYKEYGDAVICIFAYISFVWNIFIRLPDIISGAGASSYSTNQVIDIKTSKVTGFRPNSYRGIRN